MEHKEIEPYHPYISQHVPEQALLVIARSTNWNIVVYEPVVNEKTGKFKHIQGYWLDIDPAYLAKARAAGKTSPRVELGWWEKKMAYGCSTAVSKNGNIVVHFKALQTALPGRVFTLSKDATGKYVLTCSIQKQRAILERVMVHCDESALLPQNKVKSIDIYGRALDTGARIRESINVK